jgi:NAD(P)-dependent dehydrogenase (short-subunit alcohol dehydrogenase family)
VIPGIGARAGAARWTSDDIADQSGRVVVITGANSGIGLQAATALCAKGAHVIFACRTVAKADAARASLPGSHETRELDLSDLDSVRRFAGEMAGVNLDVLINNAGIMAVPQARSAQGYELQFATNVLGHFLLTGLLLGQIQDRVVTLSSQMHRVGRLDLADLGGEKRPYRAWAAYSQSKLANLMLALELQRRLDAAGSPVISVAAHPGYAATNLQSGGGPLQSLVMGLGNRLPFSAAAAGASAAFADVAGAGRAHLRPAGHAHRRIRSLGVAEHREQVGRGVDLRGDLTGRGRTRTGRHRRGVERGGPTPPPQQPDDGAAAADDATGATASDFFDEAPMPWLNDSSSSSRSSPVSSSTGAYEPVSSWRARSSAVWMPMYERVSKSR